MRGAPVPQEAACVRRTPGQSQAQGAIGITDAAG